MNKSTKQQKTKEERDKEVDEMVKEWDIVRCENCEKKISILNSIPLKNGKGFVCKDGC